MLESISGNVSSQFSVAVRQKEGLLDISEFYDPARRQYDGSALLRKIDGQFSSEGDMIIGLFSVDLFIPILTFIFGQAYLNGRTGIVSVYRLGNERYGMPPDDEILKERLRKEIIHELGHMFGLVHCSDPLCVMRSSTYVEDIDQKNHRLCDKCEELLRRNQEKSISER
jgi:archaemetzincin